MSLHAIAVAAERKMGKWEVIARQQINGQAMGHFDFQKEVTKDMIELLRMIRDLARSPGTIEK